MTEMVETLETPVTETETPETVGETQHLILPFEHQAGEEYFIPPVGEVPKKRFYSFWKRFFDIVLSLLGIIVLALPMLVIALCVKLNSKGPVLYRQERLGLNGKPFMILKFRSMVNNAEAGGAQWSGGNADSRVTSVGRVLRRFRLDELPQLFNCLGGSMTFIGPRPERPCFYDAFDEYIHGFRQRLLIKPGITGLAQVSGGYDLKPEEKVLYDIEYIKKRSLRLDLIICLKTVGVFFSHKGAK